MKRIAILLLLLGAAAPAPPSVLVSTETPRQGSLPRMIAAYGTIQASPGAGSETLSLLRAGLVSQVEIRPGETVRQGQELLVLTAEPAALATYKQATTALTLAHSTQRHTAQLLTQHLATRDQLATAEKAVADARTSLAALDRAGGGSPRETLAAPFDGIVSALLAAPGARVAAQTPLLTLARSSGLVASVGVEPEARRQIALDQPAEVEPLFAGSSSHGRVISVSAMLDPTSRLVPVLVSPGPDAATAGLLSGAPVKAMIQVGQMTGWLAPRDAVLTDAKGAYVFQVAGGHAARVDVQVVGETGDTTVIAGPLVPGRELVTAGNYQLTDGAAVREAAGQ